MAINIKPPGEAPVKLAAPSDKYSNHLSDPLTPVKASPAQGVVNISNFKWANGEKTETHPPVEMNEQIPMPGIPADKLHTINVGGKMTLNLGNYESASIYVSLSVPTDKGNLEGAYNFASDWVSEKIELAVKQAKKGAA